MIKQQVKLLLTTLLFLFLSVNNVAAQKVEYLYPANKEKVFTETVDQFYEALRQRTYPVHQEYYKKHFEFYKKNKNQTDQMDTALFREIPNASINIRKKLLLNEVESFNYLNWDGIILFNYPDIDIKYLQAISPNRQVYFFYTLKDTAKGFKARYAVYDVETKKLLTGGGTNFAKSP